MDADDIPAFPRPASPDNGPQTGMTLRDWFAGQALIGLLSAGGVNLSPDFAESLYATADAMLAERSKP